MARRLIGTLWQTHLLAAGLVCGAAFGQQSEPPAAPIETTPPVAPPSSAPLAPPPPAAPATNVLPGTGSSVAAPDEAQRAQAETEARRRGWLLMPSVGATETVTDNALLAPASAKKADLVSEADAGLVLFVRSARLSADGDFHLGVYDYASGNGQNRLQPSGTLNATWTVVDPHVYLEGGITSVRIMNSAFGPNVTSNTTVNTESSTTYRLAPRIEGEIGTLYRYRLRSDNGFSQSSSSINAGLLNPATLTAISQRPDTYIGTQSGEFESLPRPFGWIASAEREQTRYGSPIDELLTTDTARLMPRYQFTPQLLVGARIGYQWNNFGFTSSEREHLVYGGDLTWKPSPRTELTGFAETRPFGTAWQLDWRGRAGAFGLNAHGSRSTSTSAHSQFYVSGVGDLQAALDSVYLAQVPDPAQRTLLVQQLLNSLGIKGLSVAPLIDLFIPALVRIEQASATAFVLTPRELASLTVYGQRNEVLLVDGAPPTAAESAFGSFHQLGATLVLTHRLTPRRSISLTGNADRAQGLTLPSTNRTLQRSETVQLNQKLSARLDGVCGLRHRSITSNVVGNSAENEVFAGLVYRP